MKQGNFFLEEIKQNELINRKHKKVCTWTTLNYGEYFFILASAITGCISISALLLSLVCL